MFVKIVFKFRRSALILSFLLVFIVNCSINGCEDKKKGNTIFEEPEQLQEGRTRRMIWLDKKRRLILPPDTSLSITPMLAFPMFKQSSNWVTFENFQIQWTFFILFQGLGWASPENAWPLDLSLLFPNVTSTNGDDNSNKRRRNEFTNCNSFKNRNKFNQLPLSCRENRKIPIMELPTNIPGGERATIFPKIETFLNSFGIKGRACLQRAVCEVHEIPLKHYGFGLLGEFLTMFFSISQSAYARSHLQGYLKAEKAGKFGDCSQFNRKCPYSLFTSK